MSTKVEKDAAMAATSPSKVVNVKFTRLHEEAVIPTKATDGSAGFDLVATSVEHCPLNLQYKYGFGIAVEIPAGYTGFLFPRSSVKDTNLILSNCVGIIDSDYRGEVKAVFATLGRSYDAEYQVGERVAQLVIMRTPDVMFTEVEELTPTQRGEGGYGSTGK